MVQVHALGHVSSNWTLYSALGFVDQQTNRLSVYLSNQPQYGLLTRPAVLLLSSSPVALQDMGFLYVACGPMVRSSYRAGEFFIANVLKGRRGQQGEGQGSQGQGDEQGQQGAAASAAQPPQRTHEYA